MVYILSLQTLVQYWSIYEHSEGTTGSINSQNTRGVVLRERSSVITSDMEIRRACTAGVLIVYNIPPRLFLGEEKTNTLTYFDIWRIHENFKILNYYHTNNIEMVHIYYNFVGLLTLRLFSEISASVSLFHWIGDEGLLSFTRIPFLRCRWNWPVICGCGWISGK